MENRVCVFKNGSTDRETGKSGLPEKCKAKGCKGEFDAAKPVPDKFKECLMEDITERGY